MASSGSGNRPSGGNRTGSGNKGGSGNRKPAASRPGGGGAATAQRNQTAADRARDRVQQQGGARPGSRTTATRGRPPARGGARRPPQRGGGGSTARTAGIFGGSLVVLVAVIIILFSVLSSSPTSNAAKKNNWVAPFTNNAVTTAVQHVPVSDLSAAGSGSALGKITAKSSSGGVISLTGAKLTRNGKPLIAYLGSEYCPYCAATRWPFVIALSRFGTFSGLQLTASSPLDVFHSTPTLTFAKAHYSSPYLVFSSTEQFTNHCPDSLVVSNPNYSATPAGDYPSQYACNGNYLALQTPPSWLQSLAARLDTDANFGSGEGSGIPFIDFGGRYAEDGALYSPALLHGASWQQIVNALKVPNQGIGQAILTVANRYTAMICNVTGQKPGSVCHTTVVQAAEKAMK